MEETSQTSESAPKIEETNETAPKETPEQIRARVLEYVKSLPQLPGVYQFFDINENLLYVGKAIKLKSRVQSYFRSSTLHSPAKELMVSKIAQIKHIIVDTEAEALLLETTLIKRHKPPYNVVMKDDKNFQYIHMTADTFPRLETVRQLPLTHRRTGKYFGPYTSGYAVKQTLVTLQTMYKFCASPPQEKHGVLVYPKRPCMQYQLGRCSGACAGKVSAEEYQALCKEAEAVLKGDIEPVQKDVEERMQKASEAKHYEKAAQYRDQLKALESLFIEQKVVDARGLNADFLSLARTNDTAAVNLFIVRRGRLITQNVFILRHVKDQSDEDVFTAFQDQYYTQAMEKPAQIFTSAETRRGKNRQLLEMGQSNAMAALEKHLASFEKEQQRAEKGLAELAEALTTANRGMTFTPETLQRVEVYDISHQQGAYTVGSMIVFVGGRPAPSQYRKFKIRSARGTGQSNDFASLQEVLNRRVRHLSRRGKTAEDPWPRPDLFIIDGGKGQLSAVKAILDAGKIDIPVISLAKREEEIFTPENSTPIMLERGSQGLYLVQRMRDEAHRFAIGFYRSRHMSGLV